MNNNKKNRIKSINPATEQVIQVYNIINEEEIKEKLKIAKDAFNKWKSDIDKRSSVRLYEELVSKHHVE
jgi:acyl-CoA reductase-like NAD-dependent aldehyde dehydrogenase